MSSFAIAEDGRRYATLIVCVSAMPWVLFLAGSSVGPVAPLVALSLVLATPHVMATVGLYLQAELRPLIRSDHRRYFIAPAMVIIASTVAFGLASGRVGSILFFLFIVWQLHHFTKQNLGMVSFWCRATERTGLRDVERRLILATTIVGVLGLVLTTGELAEVHGASRVVGLVLVAAGLVAAAVVGGGDRGRVCALAGPVLFYAPLCVFGPSLLFAAVAYQAAHGAQYYLMVGTVVGRDRRVAAWTVLSVVVGGFTLAGMVGRFGYGNHAWAFGLAKGVVGAHFIADAGFWRLRDPEVRRFMTGRFGFLRPPQQPASPVASALPSAPPSGVDAPHVPGTNVNVSGSTVPLR